MTTTTTVPDAVVTASAAAPPRAAPRGARRVVGALAGQGSQAAFGLAGQIVAARLLDPAAWGVYALLYGVVVLVAAVVSGFVGDSLTVLDRGAPALRRALVTWAVAWCLGGAVVVAVASRTAGLVATPEAVLLALAVVAFAAEEVARRLLMAQLRFWRLVVVDVVGLVVLLGVAAALAGDGTTGLVLPLAALAAGQGAALVVALVSARPGRGAAASPTTSAEPVGRARGRHGLAASSRRSSALVAVAAYGSLRAAQATVRPALLTATRLLVVLLLGAVATGDLEAARVFVAPVLLVVGGASSYLFATFAVARDVPTHELVRRADRAVLRLLAVALVVGVGAVLLAPVAGPLVAGRPLDAVAVAGWAAYAASVAAVTPYGSLAAVRGGQARVLAVRVSDSLVSIAAAVAVLGLGGPASAVPVALCVGSVLGGLLTRRVVIGLGAAETPPSP